jgi:hypothetical protein
VPSESQIHFPGRRLVYRRWCVQAPPSSVIGAWICRVDRAARYSIPIFGHRSLGRREGLVDRADRLVASVTTGRLVGAQNPQDLLCAARVLTWHPSPRCLVVGQMTLKEQQTRPVRPGESVSLLERVLDAGQEHGCVVEVPAGIPRVSLVGGRLQDERARTAEAPILSSALLE